MNFKAKLLTFKIAGQLTDNANQPVSNISILVNNGVGTTITDNNGYYQKDVPFGWNGMIIPQSTNVTFNPAFYSHMIVVQDLINQNFIASGTPLPFEKPEWIVDETQFQYQQTITAIVNQSQNDWSIHDGDILAAFANTTCRGVSAPVETSQGKRFFLQIWSNQPNEKITFKYYNIIDQKIYMIIEKTIFSPNDALGTIRSPYEFTLSYSDILAIKDVNDDGVIDLKDVLILLNYVTGID